MSEDKPPSVKSWILFKQFVSTLDYAWIFHLHQPRYSFHQLQNFIFWRTRKSHRDLRGISSSSKLPKGSLLKWSCVVSVIVLRFTTFCFRRWFSFEFTTINTVKMGGLSSRITLIFPKFVNSITIPESWLPHSKLQQNSYF